MLCWIPLPSASLVPRARGFFLLLEAVFTILFYTCTKISIDIYVEGMLLWPRDAVAWDPLCSHLSLNEFIRGDLRMTEEELEVAAAIRKVRLQETANDRSRRHRTRRRNESLDDYRANVTEQKKAWSDKNPDKVVKIAAKVRKKAKDEQRFYCDDCQQAFAAQTALDKHKTCQRHLRRVAGFEQPAITKSAIAVNAVKAQARKNKTHYCSVCEKAFGNDSELQRHLATTLHSKRLAKSTASQSDLAADI